MHEKGGSDYLPLLATVQMAGIPDPHQACTRLDESSELNSLAHTINTLSFPSELELCPYGTTRVHRLTIDTYYFLQNTHPHRSL